jgi:hypothetical protein
VLGFDPFNDAVQAARSDWSSAPAGATAEAQWLCDSQDELVETRGFLRMEGEGLDERMGRHIKVPGN